MSETPTPTYGGINRTTFNTVQKDKEIWEHIPKCCRAQVQLYGSTAHLCNICIKEMRKMLRMPDMLPHRIKRKGHKAKKTA